MILPAVLLLLGVLTAVVGPRLLARADWPDREPVVALWTWQCVIAAVLLCCALSMTFSAAAAWRAVGGHVFATAPRAVVEAYALGTAGLWAGTTAVALACGGLWSVAMLVREVVRARRRAGRAGPNCGCGHRCCPGRSRAPTGSWSWRASGPTPGGCPAPRPNWS
jgi:hypothetical protein